MRLAVIGAGWAGLAAAIRAADLGHDVCVYEAGHTLGGRARSVQSHQLRTVIDNGQHILLGAYNETLALMTRLDISHEHALYREPLKLHAADGALHLSVGKLPRPWHLLTGLLCARGLSPQEKWSLLRCLHRLQRHHWRIAKGTTVEQWLSDEKQTQRLQAVFWLPLCIAAMNTPPGRACAQLFANVLRDSLGESAHASDILIPREDLSALWPDKLARLQPQHSEGKLSLRRGSVVRALELSACPTGPVSVHGQAYDGVIVACNVPSSYRLFNQLAPLPQHDEVRRSFLSALHRFEHIPIATLTLQLARPWALPQAMLMLTEARERHYYGQWLFNDAHYRRQPRRHRLHTNANDEMCKPVGDQHVLIHVVISDASAALRHGEEQLVASVCAQLNDQTRRFGTMPEVVAHELIVEKRATFAALPGLSRPGPDTPWPQIFVAGDWTDTGYPAVLEGAVRSGRWAAEAAHQNVV